VIFNEKGLYMHLSIGSKWYMSDWLGFDCIES